jgi:hypothetical protein
MLTVRAKYNHSQKFYLKNLYEQFGQIPENHMQAIQLRIDFVNDWVLNRVKFNLIQGDHRL